MMQSDVEQVYLHLSRDVEVLLADNETTLGELLQRSGLNVEEDLGVDPAVEHGSTSREPVTILVVSVALLLPRIVQVIEALTHRPVLVEQEKLVPVVDPSGQVVRDADGQAILYWTTEQRLLESSPRPPSQTAGKLEFAGARVELSEKTG